MHYAEQYSLEEWTAPPQEDLPRPQWTKLLYDGHMLSNAIEFATWDADPAYPRVCELCWGAECAGDVVRIVRLRSQVLWTRPHETKQESYEQDGIEAYDRAPLTVLMPRKIWDELASRFTSMPQFERLPKAEVRDLIWPWFLTMPDAVRPARPELLADRLHDGCLASHPLALPHAVACVRQFVSTELHSAAVVEGNLEPLTDDRGEITTFYFDGPPFHEWPAFAGDASRLVIDGKWLAPQINLRLEQ